MNCPLEARESAQQLLDYCLRKLDAETAAILERHIAICPACREFAANQQAVWQALDAWEADPVSVDFDRRLYRRIEREVPWWEMLVRPFRPVMLRRGFSLAAVAGLLLVAGAILDRHPSAPQMSQDVAQAEPVQPEQVERALDAMDTLTEFSHHVKDSSDSKM